MSAADDIVARLRPIRLPAEFASFGFQDYFAIFGLGMLAGLALILLLRFAFKGSENPQATARRAIEKLRDEPDAIRLMELARLRATFDPQAVPPDWREALYKPGATPDFGVIEAEVMAAAQLGRRPNA